MDTTSMDSKNSKISDSNRLLLNLSEKNKFKKKLYICYSIKSYHIPYMEKYKKVIQK